MCSEKHLERWRAETDHFRQISISADTFYLKKTDSPDVVGLIFHVNRRPHQFLMYRRGDKSIVHNRKMFKMQQF